VRKTVLVSGMLLGWRVWRGFTTSTARRSVDFARSCRLAAAAPVGWSIPSLIAPKAAPRQLADHEFRQQSDGRVARSSRFIVG